MKPATKKALLESIEHWRENEQVKNLEDAKIGPNHCALCKMFKKITICARKNENGLELCPVRESTGEAFCSGSPYEEVEIAYKINELEDFLKAAKKEREFLESLLPDEK